MLALALLLPILILILIDIASYTIARTLGVVDIVKASTSDKQTVHARKPPTIHIRAASIDLSNPDLTDTPSPNARNPFYVSDSDSSRSISTDSRDMTDVRLTAYFTSEGDNLELSGVGVFSPASSRPPSPVVSRRILDSDINVSPPDFEPDDGGIRLRMRSEPIQQ